MAIAAQWQATVSTITSSTVMYTIPSTTAATTFYPYARDLVVTNGDAAATLYVSFGVGGTAANSTNSFLIPAGGSLVLTQCQATQGAKIYGFSATTCATAYVGFATNVAYV